MLNHTNPHARIIKWAPQTAILLHPSTSLFISHGGLGSWYEPMYAATPMIMFPFFGDQSGNAIMIERGGMGGILKSDSTIEEAIELFNNITTDEGGKIKASCKRMQALAQIHSEHGVIRGADIVEEVAYTHEDGILPHRESAGHRISYIKSHYLDLYAALFFILTSGLGLAVFTIIKAYHYIIFSSNNDSKQQQKKKL